MKKSRIIIRCLLFLVICLAVGIVTYRLLKPDTSILDGKNETSNIVYQGFENLENNVLDYIAVGSSNVFMDVSPAYIWNEYGYTGYNYASPEQMTDISLYYIRQAFKTQSPKVIFLDCYNLGKEGNAGEAYTHLGLDYFPLSKEKYKLVEQMDFSNQVKNDFYNNFILYHSRWKELKSGDFNLLRYNVKEDFLGYSPSYLSMASGIAPLSVHDEEFTISEKQRGLVRQILELCEEHGTRLVLIKTPNSYWSVEQNEKTKDLAAELGLTFIDFNAEKVIDPEKDFCDGGGHCNNDGAKKVSRFLGEYMQQEFSMEGRSQKSQAVCMYFDERAENLNQFEQNVLLTQEEEWEKYWERLQDEDYVVLVSALRNADTAGILNKKINIPWDDGDDTYISFMLDAGIPLNWNCVKYGEEPGKFTQNIYGHIFYVETGSTAAEKIASKIQVDYQNYGRDGEVNFVVYDKVMDQVVDTCYITENEEEKYVVKHYGEE